MPGLRALEGVLLMAQPLPKPPNQPLLDVLAVNKMTVREMDQMLRDGAAEVEMLVPKLLEKHTTGGKVKAAQLTLVLRELRVAQSALWGDLGASLRSGVGAAALKAGANAEGVLATTLAKHGVPIPPALRAGWIEQAKQGINAILSKSKNGIPLSRAVYKAQALATGQVDRKIKLGLLLGNNAKAIAKSVKDLILPNVAGGVSYAAHRLARTEINHAYQTTQANRYAEEPWTKGMRWNLSKSHPRPDVCNANAEADGHGLGPGVYPVGQRPESHPNCLCYQTPVQVSEDEFVDAFLAGDYNSHIDEVAYTHAPASELLCP
jgi:hypothetical protein